MTSRIGILATLAAALLLGGAAARGQDKNPGTEAKPIMPKLDEKAMADDRAALAAADLVEAVYAGKQRPEVVKMLLAILRGPSLGPNDGWFGPADTRYNWKWLAKIHGVDPETGAIPRKLFLGTDAQFARLDRDKDGRITADDLDWSEKSAYMQQSALARGWFRKLDGDGNGRLTKEELAEFFDKTAKGKTALTFDEFRDALLDTLPKGGGAVRTAPIRPVLLRGLFNGEVGSIGEGPRVGQAAPNFKLRTIDGKETVELAKIVGKKPVVLVFGNYTCGPFCNSYPAVEPIYQRFGNDATFLMIYVREAHPADGWSAGIPIKQPTTFEQRVGVAEQFCKKVTPTLPILVDEINDPAGYAYSGMPSRLYVIDTQGLVTYQSGRGPFGFKVPEMEQALVMTLLDEALEKKTPALQRGK